MEVRDALLARRSVRKFTDEAVSDADISELLHAAMSGPSACNARPWEFCVITAPQILAELRHTGRYTDMEAPLAIVVCGNRERFLPGEMGSYWIQDGCAATENILLRAVDLGLGAVWCGVCPKSDAMARCAAALSLPENLLPLNLILIGHPAQFPEPRDQYEEQFVHYLR